MRLHVASRRAFRVCAIIAGIALPAVVTAQSSPISQDSPRPVAHAAIRQQNIKIDGKLDDAAWAAAEPITDFHQQSPDEGKAPSERTEIRILYDANNLYLGARMFDSQGPAAVRKQLARRD